MTSLMNATVCIVAGQISSLTVGEDSRETEIINNHLTANYLSIHNIKYHYVVNCLSFGRKCFPLKQIILKEKQVWMASLWGIFIKVFRKQSNSLSSTINTCINLFSATFDFDKSVRKEKEVFAGIFFRSNRHLSDCLAGCNKTEERRIIELGLSPWQEICSNLRGNTPSISYFLATLLKSIKSLDTFRTLNRKAFWIPIFKGQWLISEQLN